MADKLRAGSRTQYEETSELGTVERVFTRATAEGDVWFATVRFDSGTVLDVDCRGLYEPRATA
jgi:hypothetical protein